MTVSQPSAHSNGGSLNAIGRGNGIKQVRLQSNRIGIANYIEVIEEKDAQFHFPTCKPTNFPNPHNLRAISRKLRI